MPAKVGIKSCRFAGGCVSFEYGCSYPAAIVFDKTHLLVVTEYFIVGVCQVTLLYAQNLSVHIYKLW